MGVFGRVSELIVANVNALIDRAENPELMLSQLVREMEAGLEQSRRHAATVIGYERGLRRERDACEAQVTWWKEQARQALQAGREDLARSALRRKQEHHEVSSDLERRCADATRMSANVRSALSALEHRLAKARLKQRQLVATHRAAMIGAQSSDIVGGRSIRCVQLDQRFDRLEHSFARQIDEIEARATLSVPSSSLEEQLTDQANARLLDEELAALRTETASANPSSGVRPE